MAQKIILDCDPGHDDALAIFLALGDPDCELLGITTVAGNHTIDKVTHNARVVCTVAGRDVPIAQGASAPLVRPQIIAPDIHGDSGLDGPELPEPEVGLDARHGADFIIDTVMDEDPGTVSLVPVGPMTNIALALAKEPRIAQRVKQVAFMGGSSTRGNRTPAAEFNILADPEAAHAVLTAGWPLSMAGLNLTHQALADDDVQRSVAAIGTAPAEFASGLFDFFAARYRRHQRFTAPAVHDLCAVAGVLNPGVFTRRRAFVTVELAGTWTAGMTVVDFDGLLGQEANAEIGIDLDADALWDMTYRALANLPGPGLWHDDRTDGTAPTAPTGPAADRP